MKYAMEITAFGLIAFLPCLLLQILAFRRNLRFSRLLTILLIGLCSCAIIALALWAAPVISREQLYLMEGLLGGLFFLFVTREQIGKRLFTLLMIASDANLILALTEYVCYRFLPEATSRPYAWAYTLVMLVIQALVLSPMFVYIRFTCAQTLSGKRRLSAWNYLWLIPMIFHIIWLIWFGFDSKKMRDGSFVWISLMLFGGGILVYIMVTQLIKEHRQKEELQEKEYALAMQQTQYEYLQDRIEEARRAKHDLRHHIHLVSAYLNDGRLEELRTYLQKYSEAFTADSQLHYCAHYAVNALLIYFAAQAKAASVRYDVSVNLPAQMPIPDEALVVVLGNLLENAIDACKNEAETPSINVYGRMHDIAVLFKMTNTCTHLPHQSRRSDPSHEHGIGLDSVKSIVRQYDGIMETRQRDGVFTASVMLTLPDAFGE